MNCSSTKNPSFIESIFLPDSVEISFSAVGDLMVHSSQLEANYDKSTRKFDFHQSFQFVEPIFQTTEINFGNLETTLPNDVKLFSGYPEFGSPNEYAYAIKDAHFNILSTANNHSVDKGSLGIENTIRTLKSLEISQIGTYLNLEDYNKRRDFYINLKGYKIFIYNYTYGTNGLVVPEPNIVIHIDEIVIQEDLKRAKDLGADCIIVSYHYGGEYLREPDKEQLRWVNIAIDNGADIILGGHPHVLQKYELKKYSDRYGESKERLILYSMGNFLSGQRYPHTDGGAIFQWNLKMEKNRSTFQGTKNTIENFHYIPTWVYPNLKGKGNKYAILPVTKYFDKSLKETDKSIQPLELDTQSKRAMKFFMKNTIDLLGDSILDF